MTLCSNMLSSSQPKPDVCKTALPGLRSGAAHGRAWHRQAWHGRWHKRAGMWCRLQGYASAELVCHEASLRTRIPRVKLRTRRGALCPSLCSRLDIAGALGLSLEMAPCKWSTCRSLQMWAKSENSANAFLRACASHREGHAKFVLPRNASCALVHPTESRTVEGSHSHRVPPRSLSVRASLHREVTH